MSIKINKLVASNFMKLNVEVEIHGDDVIVTGKNEVGKSTFINSVWFALTGKGIPDEPIQQGKESATIEVTVDREDGTQLICTRKFKKDGKDTLSIKTPDGARLGGTSPQSFLNTLIGEISFDPFEFIALEPAKQKKQLQSFLKIDTTELEGKKSILLAEKLSKVNLLQTKQADFDTLPDHGEVLLVERQLSEVADKQAEITKAHKKKSDLEEEIIKHRNEKERLATVIAGLTVTVNQTDARVTELQQQIESLKNKKVVAETEIKSHKTIADDEFHKVEELINIKNAVVIPPDTEVQNTIVEINAHNKKVKEQAQRIRLATEIETVKADLQTKVDGIAKVEEDRIVLIKSIPMPIPGLDFSEAGLMFGGLPFSKNQFSTSKMDMIGFQISVAMNPKLRLLRIKDWLLMDNDRREEVMKLAKEHDFQVFIETVTQDKEIGFVITENALIETI